MEGEIPKISLKEDHLQLTTKAQKIIDEMKENPHSNKRTFLEVFIYYFSKNDLLKRAA